MKPTSLQSFLDNKVIKYNTPEFISNDPISIPHRFSKIQDIEIAGFFASILAWGNRKSIIASCNRLFDLMNNAPYDYIMHTNWENDQTEFNRFKHFVHRTFNHLDLWHLLNFLKFHYYYSGEKSLETAFTKQLRVGDENTETAVTGFHEYVFSYNEAALHEKHCRKHIANPIKKSACKKLNMFLRWMVRSDNTGVDFGIWKNISPAQLVCPLDVHVSRVARNLGLLTRTQNDWQSAIELTENLKKFDCNDPVKYDFALFGLGIEEAYS